MYGFAPTLYQSNCVLIPSAGTKLLFLFWISIKLLIFTIKSLTLCEWLSDKIKQQDFNILDLSFNVL